MERFVHHLFLTWLHGCVCKCMSLIHTHKQVIALWLQWTLPDGSEHIIVAAPLGYATKLRDVRVILSAKAQKFLVSMGVCFEYCCVCIHDYCRYSIYVCACVCALK